VLRPCFQCHRFSAGVRPADYSSALRDQLKFIAKSHGFSFNLSSSTDALLQPHSPFVENSGSAASKSRKFPAQTLHPARQSLPLQPPARRTACNFSVTHVVPANFRASSRRAAPTGYSIPRSNGSRKTVCPSRSLHAPLPRAPPRLSRTGITNAHSERYIVFPAPHSANAKSVSMFSESVARLTCSRVSAAASPTLITYSPFGKTHRRIAASTSRKSPTLPARAPNNGDFAASSRNVPQHPASPAATSFQQFRASNTTPVPAIFANHNSGLPAAKSNHFRCEPLSASRISATLRANIPRPRKLQPIHHAPAGAHVVLCRSNSAALQTPALPVRFDSSRLNSPTFALLLHFFTSLLRSFTQHAAQRHQTPRSSPHSTHPERPSLHAPSIHVVAHERKHQSSPARKSA